MKTTVRELQEADLINQDLAQDQDQDHWKQIDRKENQRQLRKNC